MAKLMEETVVGNQTIQLTHMDVPIERIALDYENPRIKYRLSIEPLKNGKKATDKELEKLILGLPDVRSLRRDIQHNGGCYERVILQENGSKYKAIEGNCRTACVRDLHAKEPTDVRWKSIPARILPKDVDPKHVAILLTGFHVAGKIQWKAHEKAGQCYSMVHDLGMSQEDIAFYMHASKSSVNRYLTAYAFFVDRFLKIDEGKYAKGGEGKWSHFEEFFKKKELRDELAKNPKFGDDFCRWVGDGRLPMGMDVRFLPTLLIYPEVREQFEAGASLPEVKKMIEKADPEQGSDFFKLLGKMREACTSAAQVKEILRIRTDKVARQRLIDTYEAMVDFMHLADVDLPKTE
jgi:hypothetical protein